MSEYIWVEYKLIRLEMLSLKERVIAWTLSIEIVAFMTILGWFLARIV